MIEEYTNPGDYNNGIQDGIELCQNDHKFIEKVIDAYLIVKDEVKDIDFMERYDFISRVIEKTKSI